MRSRAIIAARAHAGLSQAELAARMATSQPFVARLEGGRTLPSMRTLLKVAEATGTVPEFRLKPKCSLALHQTCAMKPPTIRAMSSSAPTPSAWWPQTGEERALALASDRSHRYTSSSGSSTRGADECQDRGARG